jgi:integrase
MGRRGAPLTMPYVHTFVDRHGKRRHYYRRGDVRVSLPGVPGEADFMAAYAEATETLRAKEVEAKTPTQGTFNHLLSRYFASLDFSRLAPDTRRAYRSKLEKFAAQHGHRAVATLPREAVKTIIQEMEPTPGAAHSFLKRLRTLMRFAVDIGMAPSDPTAGIALSKIGEVHTWTDGQIAAFEAFWPIGSRERLAFALHLYTAQRASDVHRMTWLHIHGDRISVAQRKTGARLDVPIHDDLAAILDKAPRRGTTIIATEAGKPFSPAGYSNWINGVIHKAGLPAECTSHGLRKAAASRLADAGATPHEIGAITGHVTLKEIERYTKAADQKRLSRSGMDKLPKKGGKPS